MTRNLQLKQFMKKKIYERINVLANHLSKYKNSRIFYCGAGTSGRLGVQDGAELYPTFGWQNLDVILLLQEGKSFNSFSRKRRR